MFVTDKSYLIKDKKHTQKLRNEMDLSIKKFNLNNEQERAFCIVANHATDMYSENLKMHIGGKGGTGKSQVLKALTYFFALRNESYCFIVVAPTGSAAALLGSFTYHCLWN